MREIEAKAGKTPADLRLTRRSLVAAAGILATASAFATGRGFVGKALAADGPKTYDMRTDSDDTSEPGKSSGPTAPRNDGPRTDGPRTDGPRTKRPPTPGPSRSGHCFLAGTQVLTPDGEVAIETLGVGDMVVTRDGSAKAIRWVGKMTFNRDGQSWAASVMPIRIQKGALGNGCPHRDLYLSRSHMLHLEGVLIPAGDLVNGSTIAAVDVETEQLAYFHIELDRHDVLFAEGAACETLLARVGQHSNFDNVDEYIALYGALPSVAVMPCAPIVAHGGRRGALASRLRSAFAPMIDMRNRADIVRDDLEERALLARAA